MPTSDTTLLAELSTPVDTAIAPLSLGARCRRAFDRVRSNPWLPIVLKALAIGAFMLGFSAIGAASMLAQERGVHLATQLNPDSAVVWLAPTPPETPAPPAGPALPLAPPSAGPQAQPQPVRSRGDSRSVGGAVELRADCGPAGTLCGETDDKEPAPGLTSDGKVILNVASAEVLTRLPGVGVRRAQAIIQLRERLKRFRRTSDLLRVRGIGVRSLKRMLPHLVLDPPKAEAPPPPDPPAP